MSASKPVEGALLLCLDLQPVFLGAVADGAGVRRRCAFAISAAHGLGMPIAFTEQAPDKLGATEPALLALAGSPAAHEKDSFSALSPGTAVRRALAEKRNIEHLILCGVETPICVFQTAVDALQAGIAVTVLSDCVGARREDDARVCLDALAKNGAHVLPSETVFYSILGGSSHAFFRAYTQLVKKHA